MLCDLLCNLHLMVYFAGKFARIYRYDYINCYLACDEIQRCQKNYKICDKLREKTIKKEKCVLRRNI